MLINFLDIIKFLISILIRFGGGGYFLMLKFANLLSMKYQLTQEQIQNITRNNALNLLAWGTEKI